MTGGDDDQEANTGETLTWIDHDKATNKVWKYFWRSATKGTKSLRYMAKCRLCARITDGKPQRLLKHLMTTCKKIDLETREELMYLETTSSEHKEKDKTVSKKAPSDASRNKKGGVRALPSPKLSETERNDMNLSLLRALISGGVPISFAEDFYLREFFGMINPSFRLPSKTTLVDEQLVQLYKSACAERDELLKGGDCFTCLWDGWTDINDNSIYSLMLLHKYDSSDLIDVVNIAEERHTATNMVNIVTECIAKSVVRFSDIKCLITGNPSVMVTFRREMSRVHPHMITLPCALHVANTLCHDICRIAAVRPILNSNCVLANFFTKSHIWFERSKDWAKENMNNEHSFQSLSETRWYSMVNVFKTVSYYKPFLMHAQGVAGSADMYPVIKADVLQIINNRHFRNNEEVLEIISPIGDLIRQLEEQRISIADIAVQFLKLYTCYKQIASRMQHRNRFATEALGLLSNRFQEYFTAPIYVLALFLCPKYRDLAISNQYNTDYIKQEAVGMAITWKFKKADCIQLVHDITRYTEFKFAANHKEMKPETFWKCTTQFDQPLRRLANYVFQLKGHAAPSETLFSSLPYYKPKIHNKMTPENLKIIGTIRKSLRQNIPAGQGPSKRLKATTALLPDLAPHEEVDEIDFVDELERLLVEDDGLFPHDETSTSSSIDEVFDLRLMSTSHSTNTIPEETVVDDDENKEFSVQDILGF